MQQLMQNALDGSLNEKDKQVWEALLQSDPQVNAEYTVQKEMADLLQNSAGVEPPEDLTHTIMRAVHIKERVRKSTWRDRIPAVSLPTVRLRYIASFAAGAALVLLVMMTGFDDAFRFQPRQQANMSGALYDMSSAERRRTIDLESIQGGLSWHAYGQSIEIQLSLEPRLMSDILFTYAPEAIVLKSLKSESDVPFINLKVNSEQITWRCDNPCSYRLTFSTVTKEPVVLQLQLSQNDQIVLSQEIK